MKDIYSSVFEYCGSLTDVIINGEIKNIYAQAFQSCYKLENILMPNSVEQIHNAAFANCTSLKKIKLPDSLKYISDYAFRFCDALETVIIGKSIQTIGNYAFDGCENLSQVHYRGKLEDWNIVEIGTDNEPLFNSKFCFANEKSSTALDKNGNPFLTVSCDSDFFVDNPEKIFVAKNAGITDSNIIMNNHRTAIYKLNLYIAEKSNPENKVPVTGIFTVKLPIPSTYKDCKITILHWIAGEVDPEHKLCTPFWDEEQGEYCIKFETTSFSQFDICIDFCFKQKSTEVFNNKTYSLPATTDENLKVIYTSSNPAIVVDECGNITTHGKGTATITARVEGLGDNLVDTCTVTVINSFEISDNILEQENIEIIYTHTASVASNADENIPVTYTSSDPDVVTVDENGNITTHSRGTATITATIVDDFGEEHTDTCEVTVKFTFWQWLIYILLLGFLWY